MTALVLSALALFLAATARRSGPAARVRALLSPARARGSPPRPPSRSSPLRRLLDAVQAHRRRSARGAALRRELPVAVELLRVAVASGATPRQALMDVARWAPPTVGAELALMVGRMRLGLSLRETAAPGMVAPELRGLADVLASSDEMGVTIEGALANLGAEARAHMRRAAEARARTVPVRLLFPLVFLVLPAFGLLGVVPSILAGFSDPAPPKGVPHDRPP